MGPPWALRGAGNSDPVCTVDSWRPSYLIAIFMACTRTLACSLGQPWPDPKPRQRRCRLIPSSLVRDVRELVRDRVRALSLAAVGMCGMCGIFPSYGRMRASAYRRRRAHTHAHMSPIPHIPHIPHIAGGSSASGISVPAPNPAHPPQSRTRAPSFIQSDLEREIEVEETGEKSPAPRPGCFFPCHCAFSDTGRLHTRPGAGGKVAGVPIPVEHIEGNANG